MAHGNIFRLLTSLPLIDRLILLSGVAGIAIGALGINLAHDISWVRFFDNLH